MPTKRRKTAINLEDRTRAERATKPVRVHANMAIETGRDLTLHEAQLARLLDDLHNIEAAIAYEVDQDALDILEARKQNTMQKIDIHNGQCN